jgi:hypothetical protein
LLTDFYECSAIPLILYFRNIVFGRKIARQTFSRIFSNGYSLMAMHVQHGEPAAARAGGAAAAERGVHVPAAAPPRARAHGQLYTLQKVLMACLR